MVGEASGDVLIVLGEPDGLRVEGMLDREVESAVAGEQRADPERAVVIASVVHEGLRLTSDPGPASSQEAAAGWSVVRCSPDHSLHRRYFCVRLAHNVFTPFKGIRPTAPLSRPPQASLRSQSLHTSFCRGATAR